MHFVQIYLNPHNVWQKLLYIPYFSCVIAGLSGSLRSSNHVPTRADLFNHSMWVFINVHLEILPADLQIQRCHDYIWCAHETLYVSGTSRDQCVQNCFIWVII